MKKILSVILAVAMVLGCVAALAFVIDPGTGTTPTNQAFTVEDFHVTDSSAIVEGIRVYSDLANLNGSPYDKNSVIRFAVDMSVKNPYNPFNGVQPSGTGTKVDYDSYSLLFESKTVDFGLSTAVGGMAVYAPYYVAGVTATNLVNVKLSGNGYASWDSDNGMLTVPVRVYTQANNAPISQVNTGAWFQDGVVQLNGQSDNYTVVKTDFTLVLTGVTKGETTEEGLVTLKVQEQAANDFSNAVPSTLYVTKNNRVYYIKKWTSNDNATTTPWFTSYGYQNHKYGNLYENYAATYFIGLVNVGADGKTGTADDVRMPIAGFETEVVEYGAVFGKLKGEDVPNLGKSLGLVYWGPGGNYNLDRVVRQTLLGDSKYYDLDNNTAVIFTDADTLANGMTRRAALEQLMADFGFSFNVANTYKITDDIFTSAATYEVLATADYNGNAVVIPQDPDEGDVDEGTDDEEIPDEGDVDEEVPDEGDIDEEIPDEGDVEPEPVPETGDASTAVAIALTAAALVAATGLAVVMKKAR